jgi:hypothetical protein
MKTDQAKEFTYLGHTPISERYVYSSYGDMVRSSGPRIA